MAATYTAYRELFQRFEQEACAASGLNHPNILTAYEIGVENDIHFIATEHGRSASRRPSHSRIRFQLAKVRVTTIPKL